MHDDLAAGEPHPSAAHLGWPPGQLDRRLRLCPLAKLEQFAPHEDRLLAGLRRPRFVDRRLSVDVQIF
jgi:hypothetical protein